MMITHQELMVTLEQAFNLAVLLVAFLGGWLLKTLFSRIKELEIDYRRIAEAIGALRVDLPTHYVSKEDFKQLVSDIFEALRRIEDKLDSKADK